MSNYVASQKLWRIVRESDGYYFEIRLAGVVIDRIRVHEPALHYLKDKEVIKPRPEYEDERVSYQSY